MIKEKRRGFLMADIYVSRCILKEDFMPLPG